MTRTKALLLAAGEGTRLRPLTEVLPKCLVPLGGRPLLAHWVHTLESAGVREALVNTNAHASLVRDYLALNNTRSTTQLVETHEPRLLGSAGTLAAHPGFADDAEAVLIIYADNLSGIDLTTLLQFHASHSDPFTMLLFRASDPSACGIATLDTDNRIVAFEEKPKQPSSDLANAGLYVVDAAVYRDMATANAFDIGHDLLPRYTGHMRGLPFDGFHLDVGSPQSYQHGQREAGAWAASRFHKDGPGKPAIFLDRDGTLIEDVPYLRDPKAVRLVPDAAKTLQRFRDAGFACVITTNQSGVGRGMMSKADLARVHDAFLSDLAAQGASVDAIYHCPTKPSITDRRTIEDLNRKPGPGMLWQAAMDLGLDVHRSWMIGDMVSDILAGRYAGCAGSVWLRGENSNSEENGLINHTTLGATSLEEAADTILRRHATDGIREASIPSTAQGVQGS